MTLPRVSTLVWLPVAGASLFLASCASDNYAGDDGNIFLNRRPKYGHNGTDSPRYKYGATDTDNSGRKRARGDAEAPPRKLTGRTEYLGEDERPKRRRDNDDNDGGNRNNDDSRSDDRRSEDTASADTQPDPKPEPRDEPKPEPKPKPAPDESLPYGVPVAGKAGVVYSPYDSTKQIDVKGLAPGTVMKDPWSKKRFRVP